MKTIYLTILFLLLGITVCGCGDDGVMVLSSDNGINTSADGVDYGEISDDVKDREDTVSDAESDNNMIYVFVCGHVASPGVYELSSGGRIYDAITLAGGITDDGRAEAIDQAMPVADGQTIYVPGIDEEWDRTSGTVTDISGSRDVTSTGQSGGSGDADSQYRVNINTASKEELMTLPGIGESKASDIIRYRDEHGSFKSIDELMNIRGIKEGVYNKVKDRIHV